MARDLTHAEIEELLGAYALDAVEGEEQDAVELHLRECPRCRAEVGEHREVAALLAYGGATAPEGPWDRIARALDEPAPDLDLGLVAPFAPARRPRGRLFRAGAMVVGAAAAVIIALLALRVAELRQDLQEFQRATPQRGLLEAALRAEADPGARVVELRSNDGRMTVRVVMLADGTGYLLHGDLPALPADRTYQLWAVTGGRPISAGVLGPTPKVVGFSAPSMTSAFALTEEVAGGVQVSSNSPLVAGTVSPKRT